MSLFNQIAESLAQRGLSGTLSDGIGAVLGNSSAGAIVTSAARSVALGLAGKYLPPTLTSQVNAGSLALGNVLQGHYAQAGLQLLNSGLLNLPGAGGSIAKQALYWGAPTPLFGGISPAEAYALYQEVQSTRYAKKNLFLIEVSSQLMGDISQRFNLLATEVGYAPYTITGEKRRIGSASVDRVHSSDPVELRITTLDDQSGWLKQWFAAHCVAAAASDGTVGLPDQYAIKIKIVHAVIRAGMGGYEDIGLYRAANLEHNLSRREDGLEEIQLSFTQLDTFMPVI